MVPALVAIALTVPCLGIGYFWDDYYFLTFRGTGDARTYLLPDPSASIYRPITQGLYFLLLRLVDPANGHVAHLFGAVSLALIAYLLTRLVAGLAGAKAGFASGVYFAALGPVAGLVAWVSGCQDLFAMAFVMAALALRHAGRNGWALASFGAALLCKEPAITFLPILVLWDWLVGRRPAQIVRHAVAYTFLTLVWMAIHPAVHALAARNFQSGTTDAIGLQHPERWGSYLLRYALTLLNLPIADFEAPRPARDMALAGLVAVGLLLTWGWLSRNRVKTRKPAAHPVAPALPVPPGRVAVIGALIALPALFLPAIFVRHWTPYYAGMSGLGVAFLVGVALRSARTLALLSALALFLMLGVWCRGQIATNEVVWTEPVFFQAGRAARDVEANFKRLHPTLPRGSQMLVSVTETGSRGIHTTLLVAQALGVWYRDPTITTRPPEKWVPGASADCLIRVTSSLGVIEIDPERFQIMRSGTGMPDPSEISRPIRGYARGLAAAGRTDRAVSILRRLADVEKGANRPYDLRLAGMVLLGSGRVKEARTIFDSTEAFPRDVAIDIVGKLLTEPTSNASFDALSFTAFGLSPDDPSVRRELAARFPSHQIFTRFSGGR